MNRMPSSGAGKLGQAGGGAVSLFQRLLDIVWIVVAHYIACRLYPQEWSIQNWEASAIAIVTFQVMAEANGVYRSWSGLPIVRQVLTTLAAWLIAMPILLFIAFITKSSDEYSRFITSVWFLSTAAGLVIWRVSLRLLQREIRKRSGSRRTVALAGATDVALQIAKELAGDPYSGTQLVGFYDDRNIDRRREVPDEYGGFIGSLDQLVEDARIGKIDVIYISLPLRAEERINDLVRKLGDTTVTAYVVADFFVFDLLHARWTNVGDIPAVSILDTPFHGLGGWVKRLEDIVLGTLILLVIALPMLAVAIGVKLTSKGPVFFRQKRYGLNGREIGVLKFRSMKVMEDGAKVVQATKNDPRITRFGGILRRTSLDEFPQFLQVVTGSMSIVGPRPHAVAHNEEYRSQIQGYMLRHKVKPGITGWAQVNGWRGETDTHDKMQKRVDHDLEYIRHWNVLLDLRIIWLTLFGSKSRNNAY